MIFGAVPRRIRLNSDMSKLHSECAAIELRNGKCRVVQVLWEESSAVGELDYFHAAFEVDGRWNAEFYDAEGKSVSARGSEDSLEFEWHSDPAVRGHPGRDREVVSKEGIEVKVFDVDADDVPPGSLCQTVEERENGIPRHWKHWRIV